MALNGNGQRVRQNHFSIFGSVQPPVSSGSWRSCPHRSAWYYYPDLTVSYSPTFPGEKLQVKLLASYQRNKPGLSLLSGRPALAALSARPPRRRVTELV